MCGIFGVSSIATPPDFQRFEAALQLLRHRGPDFNQATSIDEHTILGHARLSIIDLSATNHQPFSVDDRYSMTYNGEVYNYVEIKEELAARGISFKTSGDTEVVLQSYITWGEECVKKFNGMWAFAIYDRQEKKLFCSRDRFGVKPFNYYVSDTEFVFASEIKAILGYKPELKEPNFNMIANFCYKSIGAQAEETWFQQIRRLAPGHNLVWRNGRMKITKYWEYPARVDRSLTFEEAKKQFEKIFVDAVKIRMRSDVRVGSTLSSGLDSTSIVGVISKTGMGEIDTFTAFSKSDSFTSNDKNAFKEDIELDESIAVKKLVSDFHVQSNFINVSFDEYVSKLSEAIYYLESGHSSPAIICIHQVYKEARKKIKVLLEGQGADELLAGYIVDNFPFYLQEELKAGKIKKSLTELRKFKNVYSLKNLFLLFLRRKDSVVLNKAKNVFKSIDIFNSDVLNFKYVPDNRESPADFDQRFNENLFKQHTSGLVNLLHYGDALSMAESIECRLPFMDYRLVELAFKLPYNFKLNEMQGKYIQRKALARYIPDYISKSLIKIGFATPLDKLIKESPEIEEILINQNCGHLFNNKNIAKLLHDHRHGKQNHATLLFRILSAKLWYRTFFERDLANAIGAKHDAVEIPV